MHNEDDIKPAYLNTKKAARYLGCSTQRLEIFRHTGKGPVYFQPVARGLVMYRCEELDIWMSNNLRKHSAEVANG